MIKIIKGTYGHMDKDGIVRAKTEKDAPFELSKEQEARLVGLGVAEYVENYEDQNPIGFDEQPPEGEEHGHLDAAQLKEMTNAKLKELAEEMGIDTKPLKTKDKLIEAITAVEVVPGPADEYEEDEEDLPEFDAAEAVE